ncbi:unnamed protein product [Camellia sinensis]
MKTLNSHHPEKKTIQKQMDLGGGNNSGGAKQEQEQEQEQEHLFLRKGSKVEVSSDEEGFRDAWYVATILNVPTNSNSNSNSNSNFRKRKRRNSKTTSTTTNNNNNDKKYLVEYDTLLADDDATKPLREFVDVSFMRPVDDHPPPHPPSFQLYDIVDASYRDGWWTGIITRINHSHSDSKFLVFFQNPPDEIEFAPSQLRLHRDWVDRKWVIPQKQRMMGPMFSVGTAVEVSFDKENFRDVWFLASFLSQIGNNAFLVEYNSSGISDGAGLSKVTVDARHIRPSPPHVEYKDFVLFDKVDAFCGFGWWRGNITSFLKDRRYVVLLYHTNEEKELNHAEIRPHMDWIDGKWVIASQGIVEQKGEVNHQRRKRGRPKVLVEKPIGLVEGEEKNGVETTCYQIVAKDCETNETVQSTESGIHFRGMMPIKDDFPLRFLIKKNLKLIADDKKLLSGPRRHNHISSNIMNLPLAKIDNQPNETIAQKPDCISKDVVVVDEIPSHIFDDQPLMMWFEGMDSPSTVNDSSVEASGRQDAKAMQSPAIASTCINVSGKNRDWPFVKRSSIWENLECMEIFKKMPQQPHFQPLGKSKEDIREGLAIANMVTFANVVLWTSKLQFSDPRSVIDSHLETLSDLEAHGFNVDPIRGRLNELLSKKVRQSKLLEESKGVEMKINEQGLEKNKIDEEIHEIDKKMEELQEKLALATSMTKMKDSEIGALRSKKEVIDRDILKAQLDFEGLAAAPL